MQTFHRNPPHLFSKTMRILTFCLILFLAACGEEQKQSAEELQGRLEESADAVRREVADLGASSAGEDEIHNQYEGTYRLQSMWRGEGECLDANYHDADTNHGGTFMAPCSGADDQTWQFTPVDDPHHYQIWTEHNGEQLCLDGNDRTSAIHEGAAFVEPCRLIVGQIWTINLQNDGFARLHTEFREHSACLESNAAENQGSHSGASHMTDCQDVSGQLWRLVRVDAPPA